MRTLVLITSNFPFGTGETFIGSEFPFISESFDKTLVIAQNIREKQTRETPGNVSVYRYNTATSFLGFISFPVILLKNSVTINNLFKEEVSFRKSSGKHLTIGNLSALFKKIIKAIQLRDYIADILKKENLDASIVFYSYWLKTGAHAISMLNYPKSIKIARAHGSDIYEEKTLTRFLPLLKFTALNMNAIFFVSADGKEYFEKKVDLQNPRFIVSRLGVSKPDFEASELKKSERFVIVSCSNMVPLKRIDLIIKALEIVSTEKKIEWLHFGDGALRSELEDLAANRLQHPDKISYRFMGHFPNDELLKFYSSSKVALFINTSSTEGVPVSIMEAQCFGIPVIATDTGGVREIVTSETGSLMSTDFAVEDLAELIKHYTGLSYDETETIRINSINNWNSHFNAVSNYTDFIIKVNSILVPVI